MSTRPSRAAVLAALLASTVACGASEDPVVIVSVEQVRVDVRTAMFEVTGTLAGAGLDAIDASGSYATCGGEPDPEVGYAAGALLRPETGTDPADGVAAAERALVEDGWQVDASGDDPAYVNLSRGRLRVSVKESRLDPGDLDLEVDHPCVDGTRDDVPDLRPEPIDVV